MADSEVPTSEFADQSPEFPDPADANPPTGPQPEAWSSGLFGCCDNPCNALATALCPCITFGQIAEMVEDGHVSSSISAVLYVGFCALSVMGVISICCACKFSSTYRTKLRKKFNLPEAPTLDWITHTCCECCALCQEYRELQSRGLDPSRGWAQNQPAMRPPVNQRMNA